TAWMARKKSGAAGKCAMARAIASALSEWRSCQIQATPASTSSTRAMRPTMRNPASGAARLPRLPVIGVGSAIAGNDLRGLSAALQPHDAEEIDDADPQAIEGAVIGAPALARPVIDDHRHGLPALALHQRRQEAMDVVEERQVEEDIPAEELQPAAGIGRAVAEELRAHRVGKPGGE